MAFRAKPSAVLAGAKAMGPAEVVVITRGPSGHIDVFSSESTSDTFGLLKAGRKHIEDLH